MKKYLVIIAFFALSLCLFACGCSGSNKSVETYRCTEWRVSKGTLGMDILKTDDGKDVYKYYDLYFYKDGYFKLVFLRSDSEKEEIYVGTYEDKDGTRYLTYRNKPDELQNLWGATPYTIDTENKKLVRLQHQVNSSGDTIIAQTFVKKK